MVCLEIVCNFHKKIVNLFVDKVLVQNFTPDYIFSEKLMKGKSVSLVLKANEKFYCEKYTICSKVPISVSCLSGRSPSKTKWNFLSTYCRLCTDWLVLGHIDF